MSPSLNYDGSQRQRTCECCTPRMATFTATIGHKWTESEIKAEILHLAKEVAQANWFNRGRLTRSLKHWVEKLDRLRSD